ncbi:hypothetical protein NX059_002468 [Plenodomus lindquistii]|nr:hypothetical protein NX059_002468 [Plenodomus lindquistii]
MELPLYQYQPLASRQIRVLEALPDATPRMTVIELKKSNPSKKYAALSYTWGADTTTLPFQCGAHNLPVRQNLLDALRRLRYVVKGPIWIDAMCINQADEKEKFEQIKMMTDVYKSAEKVSGLEKKYQKRR